MKLNSLKKTEKVNMKEEKEIYSEANPFNDTCLSKISLNSQVNERV